MPAYVIGLDIGTSVTKAALFDRSGSEIAVAAKRTRTMSPFPGWFEIDGDELWQAVVDVCREVVAKVGADPRDIKALAITAVMIGGWMIDADHRLLRPGILWNDGRAQGLMNRLCEANPDLMSQLFDSSGQVMQLGCTLPVLAWLAENEPHILERSVSILTAKDYIRLRLTGEIATDETDAAIGPGTAHGRCFNPQLLKLFGTEAFAHLLPEVRASDALGGYLSEHAAAIVGLPPGLPIAIGAGDLPACVIGAGSAAEGVACTVLGTTCLNGVLSTTPVFTPRDMGILFTIPGGLWLKTMVNVAGTTNMDWCLDALCPDLKALPDPYDGLNAIAAGGRPGTNGLTYVPYLSPIGIIAPRLEPGARATFTGLNPSHTRSDLVRAVFEGVAYAIRDCYEAIGRPINAIRLVGGGARSPFWSQMIADVTGLPVEIPAGTEFGAKGAALLAGTAIGWYGSLAEACRQTFVLAHRHEPDAALKPAYDVAFRRYQQVSKAMLDGVAPLYR
ncbi:FGGY-family carbohydrate kinase [uncultured Devosia sp.]|uniref:FGGY-family carbohydrate kinase n=1 Tax=uncultured Devosia sp. TaxID=211434 RepID=UPI0035CB5577